MRSRFSQCVPACRRFLGVAGVTVIVCASATWPGFADETRIGPCPDVSIPISSVQPLHPDDESAPGIAALRAVLGSRTLVYWDGGLNTPRFVAPSETVRIFDVEPGQDFDRVGAEEAVRRFVDEHSAFFGLSSAELSAPDVSVMPRFTLFSFGQTTHDGLPARGASFRVLLNPRGELASIKAFVIRDLEALWQGSGMTRDVLLDAQVILDSLPDATAQTSVETRLEICFPQNTLESLMPAWRVVSYPPSDAPIEDICSATHGELIQSCQIFKRYNQPVSTRCWSSHLDDPITQWTDLDDDSHLPLPYSIITNDEGRVLGQTGADGGARIETETIAARLTSSLAYGHRGDCEGETGLECSSLFIRVVDTEYFWWPPEDENGDRIPDRSQTSDDEFGFLLMHNVLGQPIIQDRERQWVYLFRHGVATLRGIEEDFTRIFGASETLLPRLEIQAQFATVRPNNIRRAADGHHVIEVQRYDSCLRPRICNTLQELYVSGFNHEIGHHAIMALTGSDTETAVEEGLADMIHAFRFDDNRVRFPRRGSSCMSFLLGNEAPCRVVDTEREPARAPINGGFWNLWSDSNREQKNNVEDLFYTMLAINRVDDPQGLTFRSPDCFLDELIVTNDLIETPFVDNKLREAFDAPLLHQSTIFLRGDTNLTQTLDLTDAIVTLDFLFLGSREYYNCPDAMDADDSGDVTITDPITVLSYLFLGGLSLPAPFPDCGFDPTLDGLCCLTAPEGADNACAQLGN